MEFCLAVAVAPDSRNRSASMERMPVVRFSSSGVSSSSRPCAGSCEMESPGMPTESSCSAFITVRSASRTSAAEAKRAEGCFSRQRRISDSSSTGKIGDDLAQAGRIGELGGADGLELRRIGAMEGMASAHQLVQDQAQREDIRLHAGLRPVTNCSGAM